MNASETRRRAEAAARVYLEMRGFRIIEQNWRRPHGEIDIIAQKLDTIHFIEITYHRDGEQFDSLEAITSTKLRHLRNAAASWIEETKWKGAHSLSAIEITGREFIILRFTENVF